MKTYKFKFRIMGNVNVKIFNANTQEEASDKGIDYTTTLLPAIQMNFNQRKDVQLKNVEMFYGGTSQLFDRYGIILIEGEEYDPEGFYNVKHVIAGDVEIIIETKESTDVVELAYTRVLEFLNEIEKVYHPEVSYLHINNNFPVEVRKLS